MTKTEFLEDTIQYFSDPDKRCLNEEGYCTYSPNNKYQTGCAIGRFMTPENAILADDEGELNYINLLLAKKELIPSFMLDWDSSFLQNVQKLHDLPKFWASNGLSDEGKKFVEEIKERFL